MRPQELLFPAGKASYRYRLEGILSKLFGPLNPHAFPGKISTMIRTSDFPCEKLSGDLVRVREFLFPVQGSHSEFREVRFWFGLLEGLLEFSSAAVTKSFQCILLLC